MNETILILTQHGALVLFAVVFAKQLGLPIPTFPLLMTAGALAATGQMAFDVALGASVLAAFLGDQLWFEIGRRYGRQLLNRLSHSFLDLTVPVRLTEEFFACHGVRSLIVSKFVPVLGTIAPPFAGMVGLSLPLYLWYNSFGTVLWVGSGLGVGYLFSGEFEQAISATSHMGPATVLILLAIVTGYVAYKILHRNRSEHIVPVLRHVPGKGATEERPLQGFGNTIPQIHSDGPVGSIAVRMGLPSQAQKEAPRDSWSFTIAPMFHRATERIGGKSSGRLL